MEVAPLRIQVFRGYAEFVEYLSMSDEQRGVRWAHERSLASPNKSLVLSGTCGLCLQPTTFTSATCGGEVAPGGLVPNWREGLVCDCEHQLINRERALLHYLIFRSLLKPWSRVLLLGDTARIYLLMSKLVGHVDYRSSALDDSVFTSSTFVQKYHLIISVEQLTRARATESLFTKLKSLLVSGGELVFTAPFSVDQHLGPTEDHLISWEVFSTIGNSGFISSRASTFWSEEFGYLGLFNMILSANL